MIRPLLSALVFLGLHGSPKTDFCKTAVRSAHPSELLVDLDGIANLNEKGMTLDHGKFAMMKRVKLHSTELSTVIDRDNGGAGKEKVSYSKISDSPRMYEIEDVNRMGSLSNFFTSTKIRVQFVDGVCIPIEVKQARGAEPTTWATLFELKECLHDKAKSKNCRIEIAGLPEDPHASKALQQSQLTELKPNAPSSAR